MQTGYFIRILLVLFALSTLHTAVQANPILQLDSGGHTSLINDVVFTPDGRYLVSAGDDKTIRVWDWQAGKTVRFLRGQIDAGDEGKIYAMALSPDGRWLAVGGWMRDDEIRLYDFHSGELIALLRGHTNVVLDLAFSPNNQYLVSSSQDNSAIIWDVQQQRQHQQLKGHTDDIYAVAFSADNQRVVTGSDDHSLRLWQVNDGSLITTLTGHSDKVQAVAVSPKGDLIASGSWDHSIRLWDAHSGAFVRTLANQGTQVGSLSFSPDGDRLLSGVASAPTDSYLWDIASGKKLQTYKHDNLVAATTFSPEGRIAVTAGGNNQEIHLWDSQSGKLIKRLGGYGGAVWSVGFAADGQSMAWGKQGISIPNKPGVLEQQLRLSQAQSSLGSPRPLHSQNGQRAQARLGAWSLQTRKGGNYGYQAILEIRQNDHIKAEIERGTTDGLGHPSYTFTPDGQSIISGGRNGVLSAYDLNGNKHGNFIGHTGDIWAVAVSPDGRLLISGSDDQTVRLWRIDSRELLLTLFTGDNGEWVAWTPQGYYTASTNGDSLIGWQINRGVDQAAEYASAAQLRKHFYRPDIVDEAIRLGSAQQAVAQARNTQFDLADLLRKGLPPSFVLSQPQNGATVSKRMQAITLSFAAEAQADSVETYVNGRQIHTKGKFALPERRNQRYEQTLKLPLEAGENTIRVVAHNRIGQTERIFQLLLDDPSQTKQGRLFLVAVGVSDYSDDNLDLNFAAKDAIEFHKHLQGQADKRYSEVNAILLADGHKAPTANNIEDALDLFRKAGNDDTTVLFLSGHGINDGPDYYFLSQDAEKAEGYWRSSSVVKWNTLFDALVSTQGKRIMLVDTCHSGNAFNPRLLNDTDDKDIVVISSTDAQSLAQEQRELGHGVFTYALLEGLKGKADAMDGNGQITLQELNTYLSINIPKLTHGSQTPVLNVPGGFKDFDFVRM